MTFLTSKEIREKWLIFFQKKKHFLTESVSLIPLDDPSLLWINSGVAGLKKFFLGKVIPPSKRLVNVQKCIRTNDIENVGKTSRHHTFFEMLGNFSLGEYFKKEAIEFADEFLLKELKLPREKLYVTYFEEDTETRNFWILLGYSPKNLIACGKNTNFWDMGEGPCGPNTEIYYDRGSKFDKRGLELLRNDISNDRYVEIWNIVFSQFNNNGQGTYTNLSSKCIDTGAGLERIASVLQETPTNFETDLFMPIINAIEKISKQNYDKENYFNKDKKQAEINLHFKIIADHMRAVCNAINDGEKPSNVSRGYVIRRLIRRAYFSLTKIMKTREPQLFKLVDVVAEISFYPIATEKVKKIIKQEEEKFLEILIRNQKILNSEIEILVKSKRFSPEKIVFYIYETYGLPMELTIDSLSSRGIIINNDKLLDLQKKHSLTSRGKTYSAMLGGLKIVAGLKKKFGDFVGYKNLKTKSEVIFLSNGKEEVDCLDGSGFMLLDKTPFYARKGGQHSDKGTIEGESGNLVLEDVFIDIFGNYVHKVTGKVSTKSSLICKVDEKIRKAHCKNHSATHLLFFALRKFFKYPNLQQSGSDITSKRLTFDFSLSKKPQTSDLEKIEEMVNDLIRKNVKRSYKVVTLEEAKRLKALFTKDEEEYLDPSNVRLVDFENTTLDVCGGTHVNSSKEIEKFKIISFQGKGTNRYRISAITSFEEIENHYKSKIEKNIELLETIYEKLDYKDNFLFFKKEAKELPNNIKKLEEIDFEITKKIKEMSEKLRLQKKKKGKIKIDLNDFNCKKIGNLKVCFSISYKSENKAKKLAATALNNLDSDINFSINLNGTNEENKAFISSKNVDLQKFFAKLKSLFLDLRGGGNRKFFNCSFESQYFEKHVRRALEEWQEN